MRGLRRRSPLLLLLLVSPVHAEGELRYPYPAILGCVSNQITGGTALGCEVGFLSPVTRDTVVQVQVEGEAGNNVPRQLTLYTGQSRLAFQVGTRPVTQASSVEIAVSAEGQTLTTTRTVLPPQIAEITLKAPEIAGGANSEGSVTLSGPVPAGGLAIHLASSDPKLVSVPDPVWAPAFATRIHFPVTTKAVKQNQPVVITAAIGESARSASVLIAQTPKPDLAIYRWTFTNAHGDAVAAPPPGEPFITCIDVVNKSYGNAPASKLRLLLLDNSGVTHVEWMKNIPALGPGEDARACIPMPRLDAKRAYVMNVYADSDNQIDESDKDNNFQAFEQHFATSELAQRARPQPRLPLPEPAANVTPPI